MDTIEKALSKKKLGLEKSKDSMLINEKLIEKIPTEEIPYSAENLISIGEENRGKPVLVAESVKPVQLNDYQENITNKSTNFFSKRIEIDIKHLENQGFLTPNDTQSEISDEFRQIKRPLLQNIKGKSAHPIEKANLIQVTSSFQGEGKTFNAINLAMAMAMELDYKVLLVDADVIKASIARELDIDVDKGLIEYLTGEVTELSNVMLNTNIEKLTILPAGNRHNLSTELVSSDVMENLFTELSERYSDRIVIIDSPPILQTNEAVIISQKVGQIVFVVEQNATEQSDVENAVSKLDSDAVIGVVMNKSRSGETGSYYGYGTE